MDGRIFPYFATFLLFSIPLPSCCSAHGVGDTHLCGNPLGMESKAIEDSSLTASSFYVASVGAHQARLNTEGAGGAWCPKEAIARGVREWLQISFNETQLISGIQIQGRFAKGRGQEYTEQFEIEYWREGFEVWRKYFRHDGYTVLPGNVDTLSVVTNKLRPPLVAKKIRVLPYSDHRRTVCMRVELLGCLWQGDGLIQYEMQDGDSFVEGVSLHDVSYDGQGGKFKRRVELLPSSADNNIQIIHREENETALETRGSETLLSHGLGQLSDKVEGATLFTMDIGYGLGNGWVGWKKKKRGGEEEFVEILFEFETVRKFEAIEVFTNHFPTKGVQIFSRARVYFSLGGVHFNGKPVTHVSPVTDVNHEHARNISIPLENRTGRFVKVHIYFRSSWLVIGEVYFHSEIYDGNYTEEMGPDGHHLDFSDSTSPLGIGALESSMVETVVGIIAGLIFLLSVVVGLLIWMQRSGRSLGSALTLQATGFPFWRPHWSSVPTHIVTQPNPATEGVKDLLLTLTPLSNGGGGNNGAATTTVVLNGDFKHPAPYANGTLKNGEMAKSPPNGLHLQGSHYNNYGSTLKNGKGGTLKMGENGNLKHRQPPSHYMTVRSNHLANGYDDYEDDGSEDPEGLYQEASVILSNNTINGTCGGTSLRSRNRKGKIAGSAWSLSGSGRSYRNQRGRLVPEVSLRQLRLIENLGSCLYGQVHLYDFEGEIACHEGTLYRNCRLIAKTIKSVGEIRLLSLLDHEHVLAMIGVCSEMKNPILALYPAPECGDLCSFLSRLTNTPSLGWLLNVGAQIASGMNYLESLSLIHRDLAARNCLVEREGSIRISDLAIACEQYRSDYCHTSRGLSALRWWSWESILMDEFTMQSSVWSFGVTLWEILTLCRQKPLAHVGDHQISTLAEKYGSTATSQVWLPQPLLSPPEIFDLMRECWQKNPDSRPTFQHIHLFLEQKCASSAIYHVV